MKIIYLCLMIIKFPPRDYLISHAYGTGCHPVGQVPPQTATPALIYLIHSIPRPPLSCKIFFNFYFTTLQDIFLFLFFWGFGRLWGGGLGWRLVDRVAPCRPGFGFGLPPGGFGLTI